MRLTCGNGLCQRALRLFFVLCVCVSVSGKTVNEKNDPGTRKNIVTNMSTDKDRKR